MIVMFEDGVNKRRFMGGVSFWIPVVSCQPEDPPRKDSLGVAVLQQRHCCYKGQRLAGLQHCTETSHIHLVEVSVMANQGPVLLFAILDAHEG